jgi:hypothetical protein
LLGVGVLAANERVHLIADGGDLRAYRVEFGLSGLL